MASHREIADRIVHAYVGMRRGSDRIFISYGELAVMVGLPGQHRLLGGPLDAVRDLCAERGWPDISTMVVNKDTLSDGTLMPSQAAVEKHGGPLGLRREQAQVITFDWGKLP